MFSSDTGTLRLGSESVLSQLCVRLPVCGSTEWIQGRDVCDKQAALPLLREICHHLTVLARHHSDACSMMALVFYLLLKVVEKHAWHTFTVLFYDVQWH